MSENAMTLAVVKAADLKSLELLYDYTKFHIGVYLTMASAFVTIASLKKGDTFLLDIRKWPFRLAVLCFMTAGVAGGVIVSTITQCYGYPESTIPERCASTADFLSHHLGPWETQWFKGLHWTQIEHTSFWAGLLFAIAALRRRQEEAPRPIEPTAVRVEGSIEVKRTRGAA
jgi:hypothetical protein